MKMSSFRSYSAHAQKYIASVSALALMFGAYSFSAVNASEEEFEENTETVVMQEEAPAEDSEVAVEEESSEEVVPEESGAEAAAVSSSEEETAEAEENTVVETSEESEVTADEENTEEQSAKTEEQTQTTADTSEESENTAAEESEEAATAETTPEEAEDAAMESEESASEEETEAESADQSTDSEKSASEENETAAQSGGNSGAETAAMEEESVSDPVETEQEETMVENVAVEIQPRVEMNVTLAKQALVAGMETVVVVEVTNLSAETQDVAGSVALGVGSNGGEMSLSPGATVVFTPVASGSFSGGNPEFLVTALAPDASVSLQYVLSADSSKNMDFNQVSLFPVAVALANAEAAVTTEITLKGPQSGTPEEMDTDADGLMDTAEDLDQDGDLENDDSDADGVADYRESNTEDSDEDGLVNALDADDDNDGVPTAWEAKEDLNGDGIPEYLFHDPEAAYDWVLATYSIDLRPRG